MIVKLADHILSPLAFGTEENYQSVSQGKSAISSHGKEFECHEEFYGSIFNRLEIEEIIDNKIKNPSEYTFFEKLCIYSTEEAIKECSIDASSNDVIFILSTTKGNVEYLKNDINDTRAYLSSSAEKISRYFNNPNTPIVVSNACISGVSAQILAVRLLLSGKYKEAVIIGCDVLSNFIISGFQSFKALSLAPCKPFDKDRTGLNLGEAAATLILGITDTITDDQWRYISSSNHNDANHISGPSRTGEGSYRVLQDIKESIEIEELAFINVHGTATPYNDEMESIALERAELNQVPINGLKGYYGHTLGAAGILETIISMKAIDHGMILSTKGFSNLGTSQEVNISPENGATKKKIFIKILSGFGGSNAGICYGKGGGK